MVDPVLIEVLGDAVNLRVLNFFIENPFDKFSVSEVARFSGVSRNSVYKYLESFKDSGYLLELNGGRRVHYRLNRSSRIVQLIDRFVDEVGDVLIEPITAERSRSERTMRIEAPRGGRCMPMVSSA
jgi:DNA-binding IclR family transcriptional regulator